jgi:hypothetical protein
MLAKFLSEDVKRREHFVGLRVDGRIILKVSLKKQVRIRGCGLD